MSTSEIETMDEDETPDDTERRYNRKRKFETHNVDYGPPYKIRRTGQIQLATTHRPIVIERILGHRTFPDSEPEYLVTYRNFSHHFDRWLLQRYVNYALIALYNKRLKDYQYMRIKFIEMPKSTPQT